MDLFNIKCKTLYRHTVNKRMTQKGASAYFHCVRRKKDGYGRPHLDFCSQKRNRSIYAPCLQVVLFARAIVILETYYCVVLTIINVISNGVTCIYKILEINLNVRPY